MLVLLIVSVASNETQLFYIGITWFMSANFVYFINGFRRNGETTQLMGITFAAENSMCNLLLFPKLPSSKRRSEAEEAIKYLQTF